MANILLPYRNFIEIPQLGGLPISQREVTKGFNFRKSLEYNWKKGMDTPSVPVWMTHFVNLRDASIGKITLHRVSGASLSREEAQREWNYVSSDLEGGCWTFLNGIVKKATGENGASLMVVRNYDKFANPQGREFAISDDIVNSAFVDISGIRLDGFSNSRSSKQEYVQGENFFQSRLFEGCVAGLCAIWGGVRLNCDGDSTSSGASLGVFACAKNFGGRR